MDKKLDINTDSLSNVFEIELPSMENTEPTEKLQQAENLSSVQLEIEKDITKVKDMINREGFSVGRDVNIEGQEILGLYLGSGVRTPIQELMRLDDNDLPYMDEQTKHDYLLYRDKYVPETEEFDEDDEQEELASLFRPKGKK